MAKKNLKPFKAASQNVKRFERLAARDLRGDVRVAGAANDAVFNNLRRTMKGTRGAITKGNAFALSRMEKLVANLHAAGRKDMASFEKNAGPGGMLGAYRARNAATMQTAVGAQRQIAGSQVRMGGRIAAASDRMLDMAAQTNRGLEAAAEYELGRAATGRAQQDADQAAAMRHEIALAKMNHQLQLQMMREQEQAERKSLRFQQRQAEKAAGMQNFAAVQPAIQALTDAVPRILELRSEDPEANTPTAILQKLVEEDLLSSTDAAMPQVIQAVRSLSNDTQAGPDNIAEEILNALRATPGWERVADGKGAKALKKYIKANLKATQTSYARGLLESSEPADTGSRQSAYQTPSGLSPAEEQRRAQEYSSGIARARLTFIRQAMAQGMSREEAEQIAEYQYPDYSDAQLS